MAATDAATPFYTRVWSGLRRGGLRMVLNGLPIGHYVTDVVVAVLDSGDQEPSLSKLRAEIQAEAQRDAAEQIAETLMQVRADEPSLTDEEIFRVEQYLKSVPAAIRQRSRRPEDPAGTSIPGTVLRNGDPLQLIGELAEFFPQRGLRFRAGDFVPNTTWIFDEPLGMGGFGEVWRARNGGMVAAFKFCLEHGTAATLQRDVANLDRIQQLGSIPGVVRLEDHNLRAEPPYVRVEYVPGGELTRVIEEWHAAENPPAAELVAGLIADLATIIAPLHDLSPPLVHRDLKPANVLVRPLGNGEWELKVADFGIGGAAAEYELRTSASAPQLSISGSCTPNYAPPEQHAGRPPSTTDDVFALGVIWYQALTGDLRQGVPGGFERALRRRGVPDSHVALLSECVSPDPHDRPINAGDLAAKLQVLNTATQPDIVVNTNDDSPKEPDPHDLSAFVLSRLTSVDQTHDRIRELLERSANLKEASDLFESIPPARQDYVLKVRVAQAITLERGLREGLDVLSPIECSWLVDALLQYQPRRMDLLRLQKGLPPLPNLDAEITSPVPMKLRLIRPGVVQMGMANYSDNPPHWVCMTKPYYMGVHPVIVRDYEDVTANITDHHFTPAINLSWEDACNWCKKLSETQAAIESGLEYRLPTEAEWEYACRAGTHSFYYFGNETDRLVKFAWFAENSDRARKMVCQKLPNAWGLYDMHGNVFEWCVDRYYKDTFKNNPAFYNPPPPSGGTPERVIRGGSYNQRADVCGSGIRLMHSQTEKRHDVGFRVVAIPSTIE